MIDDRSNMPLPNWNVIGTGGERGKINSYHQGRIQNQKKGYISMIFQNVSSLVFSL